MYIIPYLWLIIAGLMFAVVVWLLRPYPCQSALEEILEKTEKLMTGLADLQTFANTTFPAFVTQQTSDLAAIQASINTAIGLLGTSSEDPAVEAAVQSLNTALATATSNQTALEGLTTQLNTAEGATPAVKS